MLQKLTQKRKFKCIVWILQKDHLMCQQTKFKIRMKIKANARVSPRTLDISANVNVLHSSNRKPLNAENVNEEINQDINQ
ncbi:hypothetical protein DAPPUDRAFT_333641, partial [Daphnia pulex]